MEIHTALIDKIAAHTSGVCSRLGRKEICPTSTFLQEIISQISYGQWLPSRTDDDIRDITRSLHQLGDIELGHVYACGHENKCYASEAQRVTEDLRES